MSPRRPEFLVRLGAARLAPIVLAASLCAGAAAASAADVAAQTEHETLSPAFVGSTSAATRGTARSLRVAVPPGATPDDVLVLGLAVRVGSARAVKAPTGWSLVRGDRARRGARLSQLVYVKGPGAPELPAYRWSWPRRTQAAAGMLAYSGLDTVTPVEGHSGRPVRLAARSARRRISAPALTTNTPGALVIAFFGSTRSANTVTPSGTVERYDVSAGRGGASATASDFIQVVPGATGKRVATTREVQKGRKLKGSAAATQSAVGQMVALSPAKARKRKPPAALDLTPPDTTIDSGPTGTVATDSAGFTFSSNEPGSSFECRLDGGAWTPCSSPASHSGLTNGTHTFEVRARDGAGNSDPLPAVRIWTVDVTGPDTTAPSSSITSGPQATTTSSSAEFAFASNEPGSTFDCQLDSGSWNPCSSPKSYTGMSPGSYTFRVRAIDAAGNVESSYASRSWTVLALDTTPPDTSITAGPSASTTSTSASFSFSSSENGSSFECRLDSAAFSPCSSPRAYSGLATGSHTFEVRATDAAGNTDTTPATLTWTIEAPPPPPPPPPPGGGGANVPAPLAQSTGTVFHVATTGSDSNPGTAAAPWLTVQKALNTLQAGQKALVHAGTYTLALDLARACTAAAPCTVEAAPGEARPVLRITNDHVLRVEGSAAYWRFRGFTFRDSNITSGGLVDVYGHHIEISGSELTNSGDQAFYMDEQSHHVQVLGNWIHHSGLGRTHQSHGAYLQGDDHFVANNLIHDMPYGFGIQVYDKGLRSIVVNNTIAYNGHAGIVVGGSGGVSGVVVRNNILAYNSGNGIAWDGTCPNSSVGPTYADHNVIFGNGSSPIDTQSCSATNTSGGNRTTDPLFVSPAGRDFHLQAGSPALGYALPEWTPGGDYDGETRPQSGAPDAGAYEDG